VHFNSFFYQTVHSIHQSINMLFTPTIFVTIVLAVASITALPMEPSLQARGIKDKTAINIAQTVGQLGKDFLDKSSAPKPASGPGIAANLHKPAAPPTHATAAKPKVALPKIPAAPALPKAASILDQIPKDAFKAAEEDEKRSLEGRRLNRTTHHHHVFM
jgi:hypothetical protein